ncbi:hypothetical protein CEXT_87621 [Caerostris extrusa]|uniref:Uncharacterized protein n=1 Tax=Caerostris extrusa TaxID=172846 RepID=A0AAV4Y3S7_CAEEX|nr:hypothetical protein CEXT_87621 [Caerostris extrusa]
MNKNRRCSLDVFFFGSYTCNCKDETNHIVAFSRKRLQLAAVSFSKVLFTLSLFDTLGKKKKREFFKSCLRFHRNRSPRISAFASLKSTVRVSILSTLLVFLYLNPSTLTGVGKVIDGEMQLKTGAKLHLNINTVSKAQWLVFQNPEGGCPYRLR